MSEPYLTKRELAAKLRVHPSTVVRLRIPYALRVGQQNRYLWSQAKAFLEGSNEAGGRVLEFRPRGLA